MTDVFPLHSCLPSSSFKALPKRLRSHRPTDKIPNHPVTAHTVSHHTTVVTMTDFPLPNFPTDAADRSIYLGQIWQEVDPAEVANLLVGVGISQGYFRLYWDTRPPTGGLHRGYCWVELRTRGLAVLAWARLHGLPKWGRTLVVGPVTKPGALQQPSQDELNAARQPPPDRQIPWADLEELYPNAIKMLRSQSTDPNAPPTPASEPLPSSEPAKDIWSDPSLLQTIQRNANKAGLGWGGYLPFQVAPLRRTIDPSEVPALNWHVPDNIRFCNDQGEVMLELPRFPAGVTGVRERTESLWFVLAKASGEWTDEELREEEKKLPSARDVGL